MAPWRARDRGDSAAASGQQPALSTQHLPLCASLGQCDGRQGLSIATAGETIADVSGAGAAPPTGLL
jgi:hypothetical protein